MAAAALLSTKAASSAASPTVSASSAAAAEASAAAAAAAPRPVSSSLVHGHPPRQLQRDGGGAAAAAAFAAMPWVEKYRPRRIKDIYHQEDAKCMLLRVLDTGNMPHLLLYGPPGTGKTSCALALVRELFGREEMKSRLLELNASDDRGIKVVREKIKTYAKINVAKGKINPETKKEMPAWKVVILDEADMMTHDAQSALRRLMEAYSRTTRFIFICNYVHRIIEPIYSRCSPHRFEPVAVEAQRQRIQQICACEAIDCPPAACNALLQLAGGDMRRALTLLQAAASVSSPSPLPPSSTASSPTTVIAEETLYELAGQPPPHVVTGLLQACAASQEEASACVEELIAAGWDVSLLLQEMVRQVAVSPGLRDLQKARITTEIAAKDFAVYQGANAYLQLLSLVLRINACISGSR